MDTEVHVSDSPGSDSGPVPQRLEERFDSAGSELGSGEEYESFESDDGADDTEQRDYGPIILSPGRDGASVKINVEYSQRMEPKEPSRPGRAAVAARRRENSPIKSNEVPVPRKPEVIPFALVDHPSMTEEANVRGNKGGPDRSGVDRCIEVVTGSDVGIFDDEEEVGKEPPYQVFRTEFEPGFRPTSNIKRALIMDMSENHKTYPPINRHSYINTICPPPLTPEIEAFPRYHMACPTAAVLDNLGRTYLWLEERDRRGEATEKQRDMRVEVKWQLDWSRMIEHMPETGLWHGLFGEDYMNLESWRDNRYLMYKGISGNNTKRIPIEITATERSGVIRKFFNVIINGKKLKFQCNMGRLFLLKDGCLPRRPEDQVSHLCDFWGCMKGFGRRPHLMFESVANNLQNRKCHKDNRDKCVCNYNMKCIFPAPHCEIVDKLAKLAKKKRAGNATSDKKASSGKSPATNKSKRVVAPKKTAGKRKTPPENLPCGRTPKQKRTRTMAQKKAPGTKKTSARKPPAKGVRGAPTPKKQAPKRATTADPKKRPATAKKGGAKKTPSTTTKSRATRTPAARGQKKSPTAAKKGTGGRTPNPLTKGRATKSKTSAAEASGPVKKPRKAVVNASAAISPHGMVTRSRVVTERQTWTGPLPRKAARRGKAGGFYWGLF